MRLAGAFLMFAGGGIIAWALLRREPESLLVAGRTPGPARG